MQLLTRYSHFRILPCSADNSLVAKVDRFSVALNTCGVSRTIAIDMLNVF